MITTFKIINGYSGLGPSIHNPEYVECILVHQRDVVFSIRVASGLPDSNGVCDVRIDQYSDPVRSCSGHAMLIVGYGRTGLVPYFICKNSRGAEKGVAGYYLSYDYIIQYAKYGFVIDGFNTDLTQR